MILSTEDHQDLVKGVAAKTSSQLFILPPVPNVNTVSTELELTTNGDIKGNKSFQGSEIWNGFVFWSFLSYLFFPIQLGGIILSYLDVLM